MNFVDETLKGAILLFRGTAAEPIYYLAVPKVILLASVISILRVLRMHATIRSSTSTSAVVRKKTKYNWHSCRPCMVAYVLVGMSNYMLLNFGYTLERPHRPARVKFSHKSS